MSSPANPFEPPRASLEVPVTQDAPPLWNPDAAGAWSLLFSPIFGSVLVRKNWQSLGEPGKTRVATIWLVASILMLFLTFLFAPFGLAYIIAWYFGFQRPQATYVKERWGKDYPRKGWLVPLLSAVGVYVVVVIALALVIAAVAPAAS